MTARAGGSPQLAKQVDRYWDEIFVREIERVGKTLPVIQVNGLILRNYVYIDFTEGGNSEAYIWMPQKGAGMIWLDTDVNPYEMIFVKLHELRELNGMRFLGLDYESAHDRANDAELEARRNPSKYHDLWRKEVEFYEQRSQAE